MKKRLIFTNAILICASLILLLVTNIIIINYNNKKESEAELRKYLNIATELYNGNNELELADLFKSHPNMRITIIAFNGDVKFDSFAENGDFESHHDRPEILNLGKVYIRYSDSLDMRMMYIATKDSGYFLRLSMPLHSIMGVVNSFLILALLSFCLITLLSIYAVKKVNQITIRPLNEVVNKLSILAGGNKSYIYADDIEIISNEIDDINLLINMKIDEIKKEKEKVEFLINNMNQGIIVIDSKRKILIINDYVLNLYNYKKDDVINKDYLYLIRNIDMQNNIQNTLNTEMENNIDISFNGRTYLFNINTLNNQWTTKENNRNGVIIRIFDVTESRNVEVMKREFFANASHELKSPLTNIIGFSQMIIEGIITSHEEIYDATQRTISEANRMHKIILDMLELARLENDKIEPIEKLNLQLITSEIIDLYTKDIHDKKIEIVKQLDDLSVEMNLNYAIQLIRNLIDNAIKYNKPGGKIEIITNKYELIIRDTGVGIPKEEQSRVFERFYRVDKSRSKDLGGTGLGLAIVKHICNIYNLRIYLNSDLDRGTTFRISFKNIISTN